MSEYKKPIRTPILTYSMMSTFNTCPRQFEGRYITKEVKFTESPAAARGHAIHRFMEKCIVLGWEAGQEFFPHNLLKPEETPRILEFCRARVDSINKLRDAGLKVYTEIRLATDGYGTQTKWNALDTWLRGIIDVLIVDEERGINTPLDWKTGKTLGDRLQLEVDGVLCRAFNGFDTCAGAFVNIDQEKLVPNRIKVDLFAPRRYEIGVDTEKTELIDVIKTAHAIHTACQANSFAPKKSGLCKQWCGVLTCPHNGLREV